MKILVSACLLGRNCKYDGGNNRNEAVLSFLSGCEVIPICPEILILPAPRPPVEILNGRVVTEAGEDLTALFRKGVALAVSKIPADIDLAILKARSPTCGSKEIYDGTFSHKRIPGEGLLAQALREKGIRVISEETVAQMLTADG
jgi:uncharacterized protein YbbK (DUF523 family)